MASEPLGTTISNEPLTGTSEIQTDTSEPFQLEVLALAIMNEITVTEVKEAEEEKKNKQVVKKVKRKNFQKQAEATITINLTNIFLDEQLGFLISSNIYFSEFSMFRS
ncbi:13253_t:CDS:2 [Rhizophagus irregularis]|nr:13253_t:CDS:2 [Rhizophagus irregularis]